MVSDFAQQFRYFTNFSVRKKESEMLLRPHLVGSKGCEGPGARSVTTFGGWMDVLEKDSNESGWGTSPGPNDLRNLFKLHVPGFFPFGSRTPLGKYTHLVKTDILLLLFFLPLLNLHQKVKVWWSVSIRWRGEGVAFGNRKRITLLSWFVLQIKEK